ncbi:MAG: hypothetical protein WEE66_10110 [Actinomycetota bacterium]
MTRPDPDTRPPRFVAFGEVMLRIATQGLERLGQGSRLDRAIAAFEAGG